MNDDDVQLKAYKLFAELCVRTFDYPREIEMMNGGLTIPQRQYLRDMFELIRKNNDSLNALRTQLAQVADND